MIRILNFTVLLTLSVRIEGKTNLRVVSGRDAKPGELPFVISLQRLIIINRDVEIIHQYHRICSGTLITSTWVLTAAHCFVDTKLQPKDIVVQFGDMSAPLNEESLKQYYRNVLKLVSYPGYLPFAHDIKPDDIGLMQTEVVPVLPLGILSAREYKTLIGLPVIYAGYGSTNFSGFVEGDTLRPLQIGEAGIVVCDKDLVESESVLCIASKCTKLGEHVNPGDSGGPLIYKDRVVGIVVIMYPNFLEKRAVLSQCTPISPYLEWIGNVIHGTQ